MSQENLGERLRHARELARFSQTDAAQALDLTPAALNQYESGKRRVDALTVERLSRLYGVPIRFFFGDEATVTDWEDALRRRAADLSAETKAGIGRLVERVQSLEYLYDRTGTPLPGQPHPPFGALPEDATSIEDAARWAEKTRRHFDLGVAPLLDLRGFLEAQGYNIFAIPFGQGENNVSGLFFLHPGLGPVIAVNEDQAYSRRPFTLAHELAHSIFHYDRPAILCCIEDNRPIEVFANRFAAAFLVPADSLAERLRDLGSPIVHRPEDVVRLARFFGVSYAAMLRRLDEERRLGRPRDVFATKPVALARTLGYSISPLELGVRPLPIEERLPRVFLELAFRATREERLSNRRVAELLGISYLELEERLNPDEVEEPLETYA